MIVRVHVLPGQMLWRIVRFLSRWENEAPERQYESSASYTEVKRRAYSVPSPKKVVMLKPMPPKSISGTQMLKLGKVVESPVVVN